MYAWRRTFTFGKKKAYMYERTSNFYFAEPLSTKPQSWIHSNYIYFQTASVQWQCLNCPKLAIWSHCSKDLGPECYYAKNIQEFDTLGFTAFTKAKWRTYWYCRCINVPLDYLIRNSTFALGSSMLSFTGIGTRSSNLLSSSFSSSLTVMYLNSEDSEKTLNSSISLRVGLSKLL